MIAPHSFQVTTLQRPKPEPDAFTRRFGRYPKGTVLPEVQVPYSPRRKVADFPPGVIPIKYIEALEQNQLLSSCCRHPENHEFEARKSHPEEPAPDIYIFHCTCGRQHRRFCVGQEDVRIEWR